MPSNHDTRAGRNRNRVDEAFFLMRKSLMEHPAFRVLSLSALRVFFRIALELRKHGGHKNGKLPITYEDFVHYGVHRHAIAPAIRELQALGFIRVKPGRASGVQYKRSASLYQLTCEPTDVELSHEERIRITEANRVRPYSRHEPTTIPPVNDWKGRATTMLEANRIAQQARKQSRATTRRITARTVVTETGTAGSRVSPPESVTTGVVESDTTLDSLHGGGWTGGGGGRSHHPQARTLRDRSRSRDPGSHVVRRRISRSPTS
jgi:hypothetical protein